MFPNLAAASFSDTALSGLAQATIAAPEVDPTPEGTLDAALQASTLLPPGLMIPVQSPHLTGLGHGGVSPGSQGINPGQTLGLAQPLNFIGGFV